MDQITVRDGRRTTNRFTMLPEKELPGHNDVKTTMTYTHVLDRGGKGVKSPADAP